MAIRSRFAVSPAVLIPRPETETLIEAALPRLTPTASCLELGTGSGAIAVTLACQRPEARVVATEASAAAIEVARGNARALGCEARIEFLLGSWYEPVGARRFDLIIANPPYVAAGDPHRARGDLRFVPACVLTDCSADGLDSIRAIIAGPPTTNSGGAEASREHGYDQAEAVRMPPRPRDSAASCRFPTSRASRAWRAGA
jgi:release factor glutamine methyltransferase